jgi:sigma-B regulation protein RsbU (phosphoserine phosphatase)
MYLLDVSGHGWGAALFSVSVINVLRSHALPKTDFRDPQQVLFSLNNAFPGEQHNDMFFTIWYGVYNKSSEKLVYASGGHPPALLIPNPSQRDAKIDQLKTPGFIVGGSSDVTYHKKTQRISRSSRLIVFSDGVYDIIKSDGTIWGFDNFLEFIAKLPIESKSYLDSLLHYVQELTQKKTFDDDFTILEIVFK